VYVRFNTNDLVHTLVGRGPERHAPVSGVPTRHARTCDAFSSTVSLGLS